MSWFYNEADKPVGPVADDEFERLVAAGRIQAQTLVWREGMAAWQPFGGMAGASAAGVAVAGSLACYECGRPFHAEDMVHYAGSWVCAACKPVFFQRLGENGGMAQAMEYGGFWLRALAKLVDGILLSEANAILAAVIELTRKPPPDRSVEWDALIMLGVLTLIQVVVAAAYETWFVGRFGATPGKMACGLRIVRADGRPLTYGRAFGRSFAEWLSSMMLFVGYLMAGFDREKRTLHDHVCDTRVVRGPE